MSDSDQSLSYIRCTIGDSSFLIRTPFRKFLPSLLVGVGANGLKEWIDYSVGFEADEKDFLFGSLGALLGSSIHLVQDLLLDKSRERKIEIEPTLQGIQFNIGIPYTFNKCIKNIEDTSQVSALNINQEEYSRVMKNEEELEKFYKELKFIYEEIYEIERYMKILSKPYPAPTIDTTVIKELLGINPKNK